MFMNGAIYGGAKMTKDEFIKLCVDCGYCGKKTAIEYAEKKDEFSHDDFGHVFRIYIRSPYQDARYRSYEGAMTTKRLRQTEEFGSDRYGEVDYD